MFTEKDFQRSVVELARLHHWSVYSIPDSRAASQAGFPDLTLWRDETFFFVELKTQQGRLSPVQEKVHAALRQAHQVVVVWRPRDWPTIEKALGRWPV